MNLYPHLGASTPFDAPNAHVTSLAVPPLVLAISRLLLALYTLCTLLVSLIWSAVHDHYANDYFSYFTHLTYIGLCAYFFAAGVQTLAYARCLRQSSDSPSYPLQRWPRALQALHVLLQTTITTYPVVVTIVFWALLASPTTFESSETSWSNISMHIFNTVFALAEILLTNIPPSPWLTLPASIVLLACYLAVAYITHADQGLYPYAFLDPTRQKGLLGAYIVGILACYCIVFLVVRSLVILRIRLLARKQGHGHGRSLVLAESLTQWEDVEPPKPSAVVAV